MVNPQKFGKGISTIMPPIPPNIPPILIDLGLKFGEEILRRLLNKNKDVAEMKSIDINKAEISDLDELNKILSEQKMLFNAVVCDVEQTAQKQCKAFLDSLVVLFCSGDKALFNVSSFERRQNRAIREMDGLISKHISRKLSFDDLECVSIIKMLPSDLKGQRMMEYKQKILKEGIELIIQHMESFSKDVVLDLEQLLNMRIEKQLELLKEKSDTLEKLANQEASLSDEMLNIHLRSQYTLSMISFVESLEV